MNGDGKPDIVVADASGGVSVLLNSSTACGTFDTGGVATAPGAATSIQVVPCYCCPATALAR